MDVAPSTYANMTSREELVLEKNPISLYHQQETHEAPQS